MSPIRTSGGAPDVQADAKRVYNVLKAGGIAIIPASMGYTISTSNPKALEKIFMTKKRGAHKRHAMGGTYELHKELHTLTPEMEEIVHWFVKEFNLPLGCIGRYNPEHPLMKNVDPLTLDAATVDGTLAMLINAGSLQEEVIRLCTADNIAVLGSSANISTTGTKYVVEDIPKELIDIADIVIDYGLVHWGSHGRSSTMINFSGPKLEIVRIGIGYDVIKDHLERFWGITDLPEDPGKELLPSGHLKVLEPLKSLEKLVAN